GKFVHAGPFLAGRTAARWRDRDGTPRRPGPGRRRPPWATATGWGAALHSIAVWSTLPLASVFPSGENATELTEPRWPVSVWVARPLATSHSLTVRSSLPLASVFPSGENATDRT